MQKFLHELELIYNIFQSTFNQMHNILSITLIVEQLSVLSVSFNLTAMTAVNEQCCLTPQKDADVCEFLATSHINGNETVITVPYCTHCKMNYHTVDICHDLHSELKKAVAEKRK